MWMTSNKNLQLSGISLVKQNWKIEKFKLELHFFFKFMMYIGYSNPFVSLMIIS